MLSFRTAKYVSVLAFTSIPAGLNGAIGAVLAVIRGNRNPAGVIVFPFALHVVVGVAALVLEPQSFLGFQFYTLVFTVVIWSAGRLGQRIGGAFAPTGRCTEISPGDARG